MPIELKRAFAAEALGTLLLTAAVIGSGVMAERLCDNAGLMLLVNALATGAALYGLILAFAPISGAHFNPAVSLMLVLAGRLPRAQFLFYATAQVSGALAGMLLAHAMFELPLLQVSQHVRSGAGQWLSEAVATFGLLLTVFSIREAKTAAAAIALYIVAAYWFTASTSFANPALALARGFSDTFAGIRPVDTAVFIVVQLAVAFACARLLPSLFPERK
ncbi:MAG: MIP/aquaporin family protein [Pseudomonadota bacterium]